MPPTGSPINAVGGFPEQKGPIVFAVGDRIKTSNVISSPRHPSALVSITVTASRYNPEILPQSIVVEFVPFDCSTAPEAPPTFH